MAFVSKRRKTWADHVDPNKVYTVDEALTVLKTLASTKFVESVDVVVNLGIDARKSDQVVRGAAVLPHGTGRTLKVAVFARGDNIDRAQEAGADRVGAEDLLEDMQAGNIDYDVVIATPDTMPLVGRLGQVLGPKGLMPNPKQGTVTSDVAGAVTNAKSGQVRFRNDKFGIIHSTVGKISFDSTQIAENIRTLIDELKRLKPSTSKGVYLRKTTLTSTMGPGLTIEIPT